VTARIERDVASGEASGVVRGTPTLFIDGVLYQGRYDPGAFIEYRDTALRNERDIWAFTKLPTLAVIEFSGEKEPAPARRWWQFKRRQPDIPAGTKPLMNTGG